MANVTVRKRLVEWWREPNEQIDGSRLDEAYDPARLKPGLDGKNGPDVKKMYATDSDGSPGGLGSGKKTSKGAPDPKGLNTKVESKKPARNVQKVQEEFEEDGDELDDSMMGDDMGGDEMAMDDGMGDMNPESDIPPEMDDMAGGEGMADDIRITIGGQEYMLVPAAEAGEEAGEMGGEMGDEMGGDMGDMPMGDEEMGEIGAEEDDVSRPQFESKTARKVPVKEAKKVNYDKLLDAALKGKQNKAQLEKDARVKKALAMMEKAKAELNELFSGDYVQNKNGQALSGMDFSSVRGDTEFAVVARAASGKQYTPSDSDGEQEPTGDGSGGSKKEAFKQWLAAQKAKIEESDTDPGQDSEEFNANDVLDKSIGGAEEFPEIPEVIGADPKVLSAYAKTEAARKARASMKETEQPVKYPSKEVKTDIEKSLDESFSFSDFIKGKYSK